MEPETIAKINSYPEMSEEEAKLLFIRKSATEAYEKGEIKEATKFILTTIVEIATVSNMSKEDIAQHIGNLEKARSFLASFTQGLQIGYVTEIEPKIKARNEKKRADAVLAKAGISKSDKRVNEIIEMARKFASQSDETKVQKNIVTKIKCEKCNKEVFSLKFHTCLN